MDPSVGHQISTRKAAGLNPCRYMHHSFQNCEPGRPRRTSYGTGASMRPAVGDQRKPRTSQESGGNQMPRIVQFHRLGGPEVLEIEDVPSSKPSSGEVTLRVQAIGLNRAESMFMHGYYLEPPRFPARLGYEASGIVTAIGPDVDPKWLYKNVSTIPSFSPNRYGVLGTEVGVPVHALAEYPLHLTAIEATSIWMQYLT